jgi:hypothetical protein
LKGDSISWQERQIFENFIRFILLYSLEKENGKCLIRYIDCPMTVLMGIRHDMQDIFTEVEKKF